MEPIARSLESFGVKRRINGYLEELASCIVSSSLNGQRSKTVSNYLLPKRGKNLLTKDAVEGNVPVVAGGLKPSIYHNESNTSAPVLAISASGANAGYVSLWGQPIWSSDSSYIDTSITNDVCFWYTLLKSWQEEIFDAQTGSAQPHIYPRHIGEIPMYDLDIESISKINKKIEPLYYQVFKNNEEINWLNALRDTLLSKLLSGEIDVSQVDLMQLNSHLAPSYKNYRYRFYEDNYSIGNKEKGKSMEIEITDVLSQMQPALSCYQLKLLEEVLVGVGRREINLNTKDEELQLLNLFLTAKEVEGCSANTIEYYGNTLRQMNKVISKPYTQISSDDLRRYLNDYEKNRNSSKITIDNIRRIMSSFFSWLEDEDYIVKSPVRRIHKVKAPIKTKDVINDEDLEALRDACTTKRDLALIDLLASTGMRIGELVKLDINDVDLQERECLVTGKGNKQRIVYFDARTKLHLKAYLQERNDTNKALFVSLGVKSKRIGIEGVEKRLKWIGERANVYHVYPHKFRRTLATCAIDKGMPIEQVQKLLGHAKIETTMHYALVDQGNVKISHRRYLE